MFALEFEGEIVREMPAFMVSSQQPQGVRIPYLQGPEVEHTLGASSATAREMVVRRNTHLDAKVAAIHVVAEEEVSGVSRITANLEKLHQVEILAVYVATNGDRCIHFQQIRLAFQDLGTFFDDEQCLLFGEAAFAVEVLFQELQIRLRAIVRREELILGRRFECWRLDV